MGSARFPGLSPGCETGRWGVRRERLAVVGNVSSAQQKTGEEDVPQHRLNVYEQSQACSLGFDRFRTAFRSLSEAGQYVHAKRD